MYKNKKASASATLTWVAATPIIAFLCILFLLGVTTYLAKQTVTLSRVDSEITVSDDLKTNLILQKNFESFLKKTVEHEGQRTILELTQIDTEEAAQLFNKEAQKTFSAILQQSSGVPQWWVRVYGLNEKPTQIDFDRKFSTGGQTCDPESESVVLSSLTKDKRIVLCINQEFYNELEASKYE